MSRLVVVALALAAALAFGCRDNNNDTGQKDASINPHDGGGGQQDAGDGGGGGGYDTVKAMRNAALASQTAVTINSAVVTGLTGNSKTIYIQDLDGGAKSGIGVYCNFSAATNPCPISKTTMQTFKAGMTVKVVGTFAIYKGQATIYPSAITTLDATATALPPFYDIDASAIVETGTSSDYTGCLVNVKNVSSSSPLTVKSTTPAGFKNTSFTTDCLHGPSYEAFEVTDGTSTIAVQTSFYHSIDFETDAICILQFIPDGGTAADKLIVAGDKFEKLSGILDVDLYDLNGLTLNPAGTDQYTYVAAGDHDGGI